MSLLSLIFDHNKMFDLKVSDYDFYSFWLPFVLLSLAYGLRLIIFHMRQSGEDHNPEALKKKRIGNIFILLFCVITFTYLAPLKLIPSKDDNVKISALSNNQLKVSRFGIVEDKNIPVNVYVVSCGELSVKECLSKHDL